MGVVYRARDTKLQREVALKLLPENFAKDPDRLSRFQREAQLLASLNHPNIAHIYGLEDVDGSGCIAMELVEGETLSERLKNGPLPIEDAIEIAKQVADALAAAHERGIVHRDLKPANIKVTPSGSVKVLDFGLAKALSAKTSDPSLTSMPTTVGGSIAGTVVGTPGYMSPEQARGREVDARTDIWAFGCVLYEMLTARHAFDGETATDIMAKIVTSQPDLNLLPTQTPVPLRMLLASTLNKNSQQRLQHIGDMRLFLDQTLVPSTQQATASPERRTMRGNLLTAVLGLALIGALIPAVLYFRRPSVDLPVMRFDVTVPGIIGNPVVSPNGQRIAFLAQAADGQRNLWVRPIGSDKAEQLPLAGAETTVNGMVWSPDSRRLLFFAGGKLRKIDASGGSAQIVCDAGAGARGFTWNKDGVILFGRSDNLIVRVSDSGGEVKPVLTLDASQKETLQGLPVFLPDGNHFIYASVRAENSGIFVASLDSKTPPSRILASTLFRTFGFDYASGYLLTAFDGKLTAQRFDVGALKLQGEPINVEEIDAGFSVSDAGLLIFRKPASAEANNKQLVWFDREGRQVGQVAAPNNYGGIEFSPDGNRVSVNIVSNNNDDIWVMDLSRGVPSRITYDPARDWTAQWSPDGSRLAFGSAGRNANGASQIYQKSSSGVGTEEMIPTDGSAVPVNWSPDNKYILFSRANKGNVNDTWLLPLFGDRKPKPFLESPFDKIQAQVSPDSRWVAYSTNESGAFQIVVQSFPDPNGGKWQISVDGGVEPRWKHDGRELYYLAPDGKLMSVSIKGDRGIEAGRPTTLFQTGLTVNRARPDRDRHYDITRDGQRFLFVIPAGRGNTTTATVLVNWSTLFKQ
jgi:serine/threonine protein kinase